MKTILRCTRIIGIAGWLACASNAAAQPQQTDVTVQVRIENRGPGKTAGKGKPADASEVVVWLKPLDQAAPPAAPSHSKPQLVQKNKTFEPHVLVVRAGTVVDFPNRDPFFHNVFSLFDGKRFDLGLYEAGTTNSVKFDRSGISFLFCNIHPDMSAVVIAVDSPYYGISNRAGVILIPDVGEGRYEMHVWYEKSLPEALNGLTRIVHIDSSAKSIGPILVPENPGFTLSHKNKYGQDYAPPPATDSYSHP